MWGGIVKVAILGAAGRTGRQIVDQALERGHQIRPIVRRPAAIAFAIGPSGRQGDPHVLAESLATTLAAMAVTGVGRIAVVSADGPFADSGDPLTRFVAKPIVGRVLREGFADFRAAERILRESTVDWTIMRPARLTDRPKRRYRARRGASLWFGIYTSRAATAAAVLDALADASSVGATIAIAN
jgi:uncharacterized protein YbjT (DUF2867 family)